MRQNNLRKVSVKLVLIYHNPQVNFKVPSQKKTLVRPQILFPLPPQRSPTTQVTWHSYLSLLDHTFLLKLLFEIHLFHVNNP